MACRIDLDGLFGDETIEVVRVLSDDGEKHIENMTVEHNVSVSKCSNSCEMRNPEALVDESHQVTEISETEASRNEIEERIQPEHNHQEKIEDCRADSLSEVKNSTAKQLLRDDVSGLTETETPQLVEKERDRITVTCKRNQDDIKKLLNTCRATLTRCRHTLSHRSSSSSSSSSDKDDSEGEQEDRDFSQPRDQDNVEENLNLRWQQMILKASERNRHYHNLHFRRLQLDPTQERLKFETRSKSKPREVKRDATGGRRFNLMKSQVKEDSKRRLKEQGNGDQPLESDVDRLVSMLKSRVEQKNRDKSNKVDKIAGIDSLVDSCNQLLNERKSENRPDKLNSWKDLDKKLADLHGLSDGQIAQKSIENDAFNGRENATRMDADVEDSVVVESIKKETENTDTSSTPNQIVNSLHAECAPKSILQQNLSSQSVESSMPEPSVEASAEAVSTPTLSSESSIMSTEMPVPLPASSHESANIIPPIATFTRSADIDSSTQSMPSTKEKEPIIRSKPKDVSESMMSPILKTRPVEQKNSSVHFDEETNKTTKKTCSKQGNAKSQNQKGGRIPRVATSKVIKYPYRSKKSSRRPGYEISERAKPTKMRESQNTYVSSKSRHVSATNVSPGNIPQHLKGAARKRSEENGPACCLKYMPNLHKSRAACELCFHLASDEEKQQFQSTGYHLRIMKAKGGCSGGCDCPIFPRKQNESPVRLCKKCFFDTHLKLKPKKKDDDDDNFYNYDYGLN